MFQEHVNDHGDEGIGAHAVLVSALKCQKSESRSEDDSRLLRVSEDQGVERSLDMSCKEVATFAVKPRSSCNLIAQKWSSSAGPDNDDAALEDMIHQAHPSTCLSLFTRRPVCQSVVVVNVR